MRTLRLLGGLVFALGLFVVVFAGMPWFIHHDPVTPWWLKTAVYSVMGGVLVVLLTAAAEQRQMVIPGREPPPGEPGPRLLVQSAALVPGREIAESCGLVRGHTVFAISLARDISALMRMVLGGELVEYTEMMGRARDIATARMIAEAEELGADAIVNARYITASVVGTAAELVAYGTAVKLHPAGRA
ncbi:MAG: YbjQ family protein [bacterium]|nr:YbjQ family protein [bacterium]